MLVGFEHAGMTSGNAEATLAFYCGLLGLKLIARKSGANGELLFLDAGGGMLEICARPDCSGAPRTCPWGRPASAT